MIDAIIAATDPIDFTTIAKPVTIYGLAALIAAAIARGNLRLPREMIDAIAAKDRELAAKDRETQNERTQKEEWKAEAAKQADMVYRLLDANEKLNRNQREMVIATKDVVERLATKQQK